MTTWKEAEAFSEPNTKAVGSNVNVEPSWQFEYLFPESYAGFGTDGMYARCDNQAGGKYPKPGCVFPSAPGRLTYSTAANPELARHISRALASGLPGADPMKPLTRITDQAWIDSNRNTVCGKPVVVEGKSCDEYPFASTEQGGGTPLRTFSGCAFTDPAQTGEIGASHCMINALQNSSGGGILGNTYRQQRILNFDVFVVAIVP
ncbi:NucA/NucB deoxyribonuclease domain-containing protein [Subtercola boreus]|nr:hypothetical protein [Subtercola boreus]